MSLKKDSSPKLKVIQSGSGNVEEFDLPLSMTLRELKGRLEGSKKMGRIQVRHQRIFFMGRELKTSGRSLDKLGVGALGVNVLHLHSRKPRHAVRQDEITIDDEEDDEDVVEEVVEILDTPSAAAPTTRNRNRGNNTANNNGNNNKRVVDLLDDDDDEVAAAPVAATAKSRRKRRR
mmetsp:Transcript_1082/g.2976  ORF Transcript_1082/g.2976 Transcript_1082/m.2976 type:complete len:176 (-) Transcript_1082:242-769(-)